MIFDTLPVWDANTIIAKCVVEVRADSKGAFSRKKNVLNDYQQTQIDLFITMYSIVYL